MNEADGRPTAVLRSSTRCCGMRLRTSLGWPAALSEWSASDIPERLAEIHGFLYGRSFPMPKLRTRSCTR